jgi:hypothetical protein
MTMKSDVKERCWLCSEVEMRVDEWPYVKKLGKFCFCHNLLLNKIIYTNSLKKND